MNQSKGISYSTSAFLVLLALKLSDVIGWSWWLVTLPLWFVAALVVLVPLAVFIVAAFVVISTTACALGWQRVSRAVSRR
ncbi:MAG: hypothetical protein QM755_23755 [Luteolibacter sp.]